MLTATYQSSVLGSSSDGLDQTRPRTKRSQNRLVGANEVVFSRSYSLTRESETFERRDDAGVTGRTLEQATVAVHHRPRAMIRRNLQRLLVKPLKLFMHSMSFMAH